MNLFKTKYTALNVFTLMAVYFIGLGVYEQQYPWWYMLLLVLVYLIFCALGSMNIQWNFYNNNVNEIPMLYMKYDQGKFQVHQRKKEVVLTFDDGPHEYTKDVLDILKRENVPAVFFLIGKNVAQNEALVKRMHEEGHQIGNHSYEHSVHFDWQSSSKMLEEINKTSAAITAITGATVTLIRPPFGVTNPMLANAIKKSQLKSIGWSIRSMDTVAKDAEKLKAKIMKQLKPGAIILLHDRCEITKAILPDLIQMIKKNGYDIVRLP